MRSERGTDLPVILLRDDLLPLFGSEATPATAHACRFHRAGSTAHRIAATISFRANSCLPSGVNRPVTQSFDARGSGGPIGSPDATSHSSTVPSALDVARVRPSGENSTHMTKPRPTASGVPTSRHSSVDHRCTLPSTWPVASRRPSGENATARTSLSAASLATRSPLSTSRISTPSAACVAESEGDRDLGAVRAEVQPEGVWLHARRRPDRLAPGEIPVAHVPPDARRRTTGRAERKCLLDGAVVTARDPEHRSGIGARPPARGSSSGPMRRPRPDVPDPNQASTAGHRQAAPVGCVVDGRRRRPVEGLERAGSAQGLDVDELDAAVEPCRCERAPFGADGERGREALLGDPRDARAKRAREPAIAGHVPRSRGRVGARRVESVPVGTESLARDGPVVPGERLHGTSFAQAPHEQAAVIASGGEPAAVGAEHHAGDGRAMTAPQPLDLPGRADRACGSLRCRSRARASCRRR